MSKKSTVAGLILLVGLLYFFYDDIFGFLVRPSFRLSVNPELIVLYRYKGSVNNTKISILSIDGYNGQLSIDVHLAGAIIIGDVQMIHPSEVSLEANQQVSFELTFRAVSITPGTYYADIVASDGQLKSSERIAITVPA